MRQSRLQEMAQFIRSSGTVSLDTLCEHFEVSKNTVRRDIAELLQIYPEFKKNYGGITVQKMQPVPPPFQSRQDVNQGTKAQLGKLAASLINDGDIIYVDSGTTTCNLVDYLKDKKNVILITNSLEAINRAALLPNLKVVSLSGTLNRNTLSFTGQSTIRMLEDYNIGKAFMAANGLTAQNGATQSTSIEFAIKKMVVGCSKEVIMMVESKKFQVVSLMTYCRLDEIQTIITDAPPPADFQKAFALTGGKLMTLQKL